VPLAAIFATTAQIGNHVNTPGFKPGQSRGGEPWTHADIEAAIAIQQGGIGSVQLHVITMHDEHGNGCAIFAVIPNLIGNYTVNTDFHGELMVNFQRIGIKIIFESGGRIGEG